MKKKLLFLIIALAILALISTNGAKGKIYSYFNGDALYYRGAVYLVTTDSGMAELYQIDNNQIVLTSKIKATAESAVCDGFVDGVLNVELGGLFLFLTDGKYVYKYDINNPSDPRLFKKSNDGTSSVFLGLGKMDNKVYSVAEQGIKIWDDDLAVFYNATLTNSIPHNLKFSKKGGFIFNVNNDKLEIYDAYSPKLISLIDIQASDNHERNIFNDETSGTIYAVDDRAVKQFDFAGNVIESFKHTSSQGYDIAYTPGDDHLFFSDGIGIVKLNKNDLKPLSWIYTKNFNGTGGWATGLKVVRDDYGEKIIIFTGNNIVILNQDLKKVGAIATSDPGNICLAQESVFLSVNLNSATPGSEVFLSGRGFDPGEEVSIYLADKKVSSAKADNYGRFYRAVVVPSIKSGLTNIKAMGESSNKNYEVNFQIEGATIPTGSKPVMLDKYSAISGEEILVSGIGYNPKEYVLIYLSFDKIGVALVDSAGAFSKTVKIPTVQSGAKDIRVQGNDSAISHSVDFRVY